MIPDKRNNQTCPHDSNGQRVRLIRAHHRAAVDGLFVAWNAARTEDIPEDLRAALQLFVPVEAGRRFMRLLV